MADKKKAGPPTEAKYDHLVKLLMIGDSSVGKTCMVVRYTENKFSENYMNTIGLDFKIKNVIIEGKTLKLQIWDTAGQERYRTITKAYYRGCLGVVLMYDVTNQKSFDNIRTWMKLVNENSSENTEVILVGNKTDCVDKRQVSKALGEQLAMEYGLKFVETSAKLNENVDKAFLTLVTDIFQARFSSGASSQIVNVPKAVAPASGGDGKITLKKKPTNNESSSRSTCGCS